VQEAIIYIAQHAIWYQGSFSDRLKASHSFRDQLTPEELAEYKLVWKISELSLIPGSHPADTTFPSGNHFFILYLFKLANGTTIHFESKETSVAFVYIDLETSIVKNMLTILSSDDFFKCLDEGGAFESCEKPSLEIGTPSNLQ